MTTKDFEDLQKRMQALKLMHNYSSSSDSSEAVEKFIDESKISHLFTQQYKHHEFTLFEYCILIKNCGIFASILTNEMAKYTNDDKYDKLQHFKPFYQKRGGYDYVTKLYKKASDRNEFIIKQISFLISQYAVTFSYRTNKNYSSSDNNNNNGIIHNSFSNNLRLILKQSIPVLHDHIIDIVVNQYIGYIQWLEPAEFARKELGREISGGITYKYPLEFENNNTIFRYPIETIDGIYIPSNFSINLNLNKKALYIFHIHVISKGDELHIGFKSKHKFQLEYTYYFRRKDDSIMYYGGREDYIEDDNENHKYGWDSKYGAIQGMGEVLVTEVEPFRSGDFVSIMIYCDEEMGVYGLVFFKNGKAVSKMLNIEELKEYGDLILFGNVDYNNDAMYIEQAIYTDQLKL